MLSKRFTAALVIVTGIVLELAMERLTGRSEAWDSDKYWTIGLPCALLIAFVIGVLSKDTDWLWAFALVPSQVATMMVRSREIGNLWPLTIAFSAILSLPFVIAALVGARFRRQPPTVAPPA